MPLSAKFDLNLIGANKEGVIKAGKEITLVISILLES